MRSRVAVLVAGLAAAPLSWPAHAAGLPQVSTPSKVPVAAVPDPVPRTPGTPPAATWDTFTADVTIRRRLVKKDGSIGPEAPEMRYRWVRTLEATGWKTTMTVLSLAPHTVQGTGGPRQIPAASRISRIEIGDPRMPTRVFDAAGNLVFMVPTAPVPAAETDPLVAIARRVRPGTEPRVRQASAGADAALAMAELDAPGAGAEERSRDWAEHVTPTVQGRVARLAALTREMGRPQGSVRGLDRFVSRAGETMTEVLADPTWAVPVEINVVRDGALISHAAIDYEQGPGYGLIRRRIRSEQLVSAESGDRAAADIEFTNIRLALGGAR